MPNMTERSAENRAALQREAEQLLATQELGSETGLVLLCHRSFQEEAPWEAYLVADGDKRPLLENRSIRVASGRHIGVKRKWLEDPEPTLSPESQAARFDSFDFFAGFTALDVCYRSLPTHTPDFFSLARRQPYR